MITAGPTHEFLDPVRYLGNMSSGKMGYAIAEEFARRGASVILVSGPVSIETSEPGIRLVRVTTAEEMYLAATKHFPEADVAILAAAVADYTPAEKSDSKMKRKGEEFMIKLKPTRDIAAEIGASKRKNQFVAGFALETDNELDNALSKLKRKNLDMIVLNSLRDEGAGFQTDTNRITIIDKSNNIDKFELKSKKEVAVDIVRKISESL